MKAFFAYFLSRKKVGGGDNRARTDDPLLAKQVLSQLSYTPISQGWDSAEGSPSIPLKT